MEEKEKLMKITINTKGQQLIRNLMNTEDAAKAVFMEPERLFDLAESGYCPSVYIDGQGPLFRKTDLITWMKENLVENRVGQKQFSIVVSTTAHEKPDINELPVVLGDLYDKLFIFPLNSKESYVYFLCNFDEIVYVGQSKRIFSRIETHYTNPEKEFNRVYYMRVPHHILNETEADLIKHLKPKYNVFYNWGDRNGGEDSGHKRTN